MKINEIKGNTFCIDTGLSYIPFYKVNNNEIILLDSGLARGERKRIESFLEENNFKVLAIICSHAHVDHIGNNSYFKNKYNCIIAMPTTEAIVCSSCDNLKTYYKNLAISEIEGKFYDMVCKTDVLISREENCIDICGTQFKVFQTPGHSLQHICITTPDDVTYLGDSLVSYKVMRGAKLPYTFNLAEDLKSKNELYKLKSSKYIVAHKDEYDEITKLIEDNIEFYKNRAKRISSVIEGYMTSEEIFNSAVKRYNINVNDKYKCKLVERILGAYIEYLKETEEIKVFNDKGVTKFSKANKIL